MQHIREILPKVLQQRGLKADADAAWILRKANAWIQDKLGKISGEARAVSLSGSQITIEVGSPVAAQECFGLHRDLLAYLRREFPTVTVEHVRIVRGRAAATGLP